MIRNRKGFFPALLLILALMLGTVVSSTSAGGEAETGVLEPEEIGRLFQNYISENGLNAELISVAYVYTGTGETWYHQEDKWYYSASLYKVPLMMILAERESAGELTQESVINGMDLSTIEEEVLVQSNNDIAYSAMLSIAQPDVCRGMFRRYSELPEDYYTWDFYGGSYFTARFMSDVMTTLYREPQRFPHIISRMKKAQPGHFFHLTLGETYEIAQKYGNYHDEDGADWNHTTGIVFTPTPFILTVMTRYGGIAETVISDLAALFCDYTLEADERLHSIHETYESETENEDPPQPEHSEDPHEETYALQTGDQTLQTQRSSENDNDGRQVFRKEEYPEQDQAAETESARIAVLACCTALTAILAVFQTIQKRRESPDRTKKRKH